MLSYSSSTTGDRVGLRFFDMSDVIINVNQGKGPPCDICSVRLCV
jgi:hypothetical protein